MLQRNVRGPGAGQKTPEIFVYSRSSRKRPPREFEQVVVTRAGRLQECALVSDQMVKQWRMVAYGSFRDSALFGRIGFPKFSWTGVKFSKTPEGGMQHKVNQLLQKYESEGWGTLKGHKTDLKVEENCQPSFHKPCQVPYIICASPQSRSRVDTSREGRYSA